MDFNVIREYIVNADIVGENVFLFEKPLQIECTDYIIYTFKEITGGAVKQYQLDIRVVGKDKLIVLSNMQKIIDLLDIYNNFCKIQDDETVIRSIKMINGGGMAFDDESNEYNAVAYFNVII